MRKKACSILYIYRKCKLAFHVMLMMKVPDKIAINSYHLESYTEHGFHTLNVKLINCFLSPPRFEMETWVRKIQNGRLGDCVLMKINEIKEVHSEIWSIQMRSLQYMYTKRQATSMAFLNVKHNRGDVWQWHIEIELVSWCFTNVFSIFIGKRAYRARPDLTSSFVYVVVSVADASTKTLFQLLKVFIHVFCGSLIH